MGFLCCSVRLRRHLRQSRVRSSTPRSTTDDIYEYRHVVVPQDMAKLLPKNRLLSEGWVFFFSLVGTIPLAERLGNATEQLAFYTGPIGIIFTLPSDEGLNFLLPERPGAPDCLYFIKTPRYKFGVRCKFNHPKDKGSIT